MNQKRNRNNSFFFSLLLLLPHLLYANNYYVSPNGNDSWPGTEAQPWKTVSKANRTAAAGDIIFFREGAYNESINPVRSGTADDPIIFRSYDGETAIFRGPAQDTHEAVVAIGYPGQDAGWQSTSYIIIENIRIEPAGASYGIVIYGRNTFNTIIRNCEIICVNPTPPRNHGILVGSAKHTLIENNYFNGDWDIGIITTASPKYTVIRRNTILNPVASCIDIQTSYGENQACLIEENRLEGSQVEDGIQFEPDYSLSFDPGSQRGVVIRNNVICNNAENAIDLKGAANVVIEGNIIYGNRGDNDGAGNLGGGTGGIMKGDISSTQAHTILIRRNLIYDNMGGVAIPNRGWIVAHNMIIGNNRTYMGPNTSADEAETAPTDYLRRVPGLTGVIIYEPYAEDFNRSAVKNNLIGGHNQGEIAVLASADMRNTEIDGNIYFNPGETKLSAVHAFWNWEQVSFDQMKSFYSNMQHQPAGSDANSLVTNNPGIHTGDEMPVGEGPFDFRPDAASVCINNGVPLTYTLSAGSGRIIPVQNSLYFSDGYEIVDGDSIQIFSTGQIARIVSVDHETNTITVNRNINWRENDGVSHPFTGTKPDVGAFQLNVPEVPVQPLEIDASQNARTDIIPFTVDFQAGAAGGTGPFSYTWQIGESIVYSEPSPRHTFTVPGEYAVKLTVEDSQGRTAEHSFSITALAPLHMSVSAVNNRGIIPFEVSFESQAAGGKPPYVYSWDFGDGKISAEANPANIYTLPGDFNAELTVTDQLGNTYTDEISIQIKTPLSAQIQSSETSGAVPLDIDFSAQNSGGFAPYAINWLIEGEKFSSENQFAYSFNSPGAHMVYLEVTDQLENKSIDSVTVITSADQFMINLKNTKLTDMIPFQMKFEAEITGGTAPFEYAWTIGESSVYSEASPAHDFTEPGEYSVLLAVKDAYGSAAEKSFLITALSPLNMSIEAENSSGIIPFEVSFLSEAAGGEPPYTYSWDFGNGQSSSEANPAHIYTAAGDFNAVLTVTDQLGNTYSDKIGIQTKPPLTAQIRSSQLSGTVPLNITFESDNLGGFAPYQYNWRINGEGLSSENQFSYVFDSAGSHMVYFELTDQFQNKFIDSVEVNSHAVPANIVINNIQIFNEHINKDVSRIKNTEMVQLIISIDHSEGWSQIAYADIHIKKKDSPLSILNERGGAFHPESSYVLSFSIADQTLWAKQTNQSAQWHNLSAGSEGVWALPKGSALQVNTSEKQASCRLSLLEEALHGNWEIHAVAYDVNQNQSDLFVKDIFVQSKANTPFAEIEVTSRNIQQVVFILHTSSNLSKIPESMQFIDSSNQIFDVQLNGNLPSNRMTGLLNIPNRLKGGKGVFMLPYNALVDTEGNLGEAIVSGNTLDIKKDPPPAPRNVQIVKSE